MLSVLQQLDNIPAVRLARPEPAGGIAAAAAGIAAGNPS